MNEDFPYRESLEVARDIIEEFYKPRTVRVYRTFVYNPPTDYDLTPQTYRIVPEVGDVVEMPMTKEMFGALPLTEQREYVGKRAISVNVSKEKAIKAATTAYKTALNRFGTEYAEEYIKNERGIYVGALDITGDVAVISKFHNGHANVLLHRGVQIEDILARDVEIETYNYKGDGE